MFLVVLGILDIIFGILLGISGMIDFAGSFWVMVFGIVAILKGLYSLATAASSGFYFDVLGILDLLAGIFLLLTYGSIFFDFFVYFGIIMILKGLYSVGMGFVKD